VPRAIAIVETLAKEIGEKAPEVVEDLKQAFMDMLPDDVRENVENLITTFKNLRPVIAAVVAGIVAFGTAMNIVKTVGAVTSGINAFKKANEATTIAQSALNAVMNANPFVLIVTAIAALVAAFITLWNTSEGFRNFWIGLGTTIVNVAQGAWQTFLGILERIDQWSIDLYNTIAGLWNRIVEWWEGVKEYWAGVFAGISAAFTAIVTAIQTAWNDAVAFVQSIPERVGAFFQSIIDKVTTWATDMKNKAKDAITGFKNGIVEKFTEVREWFEGLPDRILTAIGDTGKILFDAGKKVITGFWDGLKNVWDNVTGWFEDITTSISNLKGPEERDAKFLVKNGLVTMQGYLGGLEKGWGDVEDWLQDRTTDIPLTMSGSYSGAVSVKASGAANNTNALLTQLIEKVDNLASLEVVLDSGKLVGGIAPQMDKTLGRRAALAGVGF
jgi:phage-related protein